MKPKTIIGLLLIIGFTSLLFLNFGEQVGGYMNFTEAESTGGKAHVVGKWINERPLSYDAQNNIFSFYMEDEVGNVRQVKYRDPKPANFEDAERLVIEGMAHEGAFEASHILVKCPSKYNEQRGVEPAT